MAVKHRRSAGLALALMAVLAGTATATRRMLGEGMRRHAVFSCAIDHARGGDAFSTQH
jgi:hypothetical protein